jgi:predicted TIM-barrel fold metal-dependent hydrolase
LIWGSDWPCTNFEGARNLRVQVVEAQSWFEEGLHGVIFFENALGWYWGDG